jgi:hypothetical protein
VNAQERYRMSEKCRATRARYRTTEAYKASRARYLASDKGKAAIAKYRESDTYKRAQEEHRKTRAKAAHRRQDEQRKAQRAAEGRTSRIKLTFEQAEAIRQEYATGRTSGQLARRYRVSVPTIFDVLHGRTHRAPKRQEAA